MKTYVGDRTIDGVLVTVDGARIDPKAVDARHSDDFEWSYEGPAPRQLAHALLADHLGDGARAAALSARFMKDVVANFQNEWEMTTADIDRVLQGYGATAA